MKVKIEKSCKLYPQAIEILEELRIKNSEDGKKVVFKESNENFVENLGDEFVIHYSNRADAFALLAYTVTHSRLKKHFITHKLTERGYMLDCSRNAVMTKDVVKKLIRELSLFGYNLLMLYTEDTIEVDNEPYFGYMRGRYTKEELKELDAYAKSFGIELVPCLEGLAHMARILVNHNYRYDRKIHDLEDVLLVGSEDTYALLENVVKTCRECFSTNRLHFGLDEAYLLGRGNYANIHGLESKFDIMLYHVNRLNELCKKYGFSMIIWPDMLTKEHNGKEGNVVPVHNKSEFPEDVTLMPWNYYADSVEQYDHIFKQFADFKKNPIAFAGGAWKWSGFTPANTASLLRIECSLKSMMKHNIKFYLLTGWGDAGGECSAFATLPCIAYLGELDQSIKGDHKVFEKLTNMKFEEFLMIDYANRPTYDNLSVPFNSAYNYSLVFNDLFLGLMNSHITLDFDGFYQHHYDAMLKSNYKKSPFRYLFETQLALLKLIRYRGTLPLKIREHYEAKNLDELAKDVLLIKQAIKDTKEFFKIFRKQWLQESKVFGLEVQDIRFGGLINRMELELKKLEEFVAGKIDTIEELDEKVLDEDGHGEKFNQNKTNVQHNFNYITSRSEI